MILCGQKPLAKMPFTLHLTHPYDEEEGAAAKQASARAGKPVLQVSQQGDLRISLTCFVLGILFFLWEKLKLSPRFPTEVISP